MAHVQDTDAVVPKFANLIEVAQYEVAKLHRDKTTVNGRVVGNSTQGKDGHLRNDIVAVEQSWGGVNAPPSQRGEWGPLLSKIILGI